MPIYVEINCENLWNVIIIFDICHIQCKLKCSIDYIPTGLSAEDHKQTDGTFKCPDCGFKFESSEKFDEHRGEHNELERT